MVTEGERPTFNVLVEGINCDLVDVAWERSNDFRARVESALLRQGPRLLYSAAATSV